MEKLGNQTGFLILKDDGAVLESGGELENDERSATVVMELLHLTDSIDENFMPASSCERMYLVYEEYTYSICMSNKKIYVVKLKNPNEGNGSPSTTATTTTTTTPAYLDSDSKGSNILT